MTSEQETCLRVSMIVMLAYTGDKRLNAVMSIAGRARANV